MQGLSDVLLKFWPSVVLFVSGFFTTSGLFHLLRLRNFTSVIMHTESPYQDAEQLERGSLADLNIINDPTNLEQFRELGPPAEYFPHCYRPAVHYPRTGPRDPGMSSDLCFVGTAFRSRIEFFEKMDLSGLDVLLAGTDWAALPPDSPASEHVASGLHVNGDCLDNPQTAEVYRNAKMSLNFYRREAEEDWDGQAYAMGPREVELAACRTFFLRDPRPESDELFGKILPAFDGPAEAGELIRWWLARDRLREKRAAQAREAIADRTFEASARRLLTILDGLR